MKKHYLVSIESRFHRNISFTCLLICLLFIISCKKSDNNKEKNNGKTYLPTTIHPAGGTADEDVKVTYVANTNMIATYNEGSDNSVVFKFTYTADKKPLTFDYADDSGEAKGTYVVNSAGRITRVNITLGADQTGYDYATYNYDGKGNITSVDYFDADDTSEGELDMDYDAAGNITGSTLVGGSGDLQSYQYDTKNGVFKNIAYIEMFLILGDPSFSTYKLNNPVAITNLKSAAFNQSLAYVYNADGYPTKLTTSYNDGTNDDVTEFTYVTN